MEKHVAAVCFTDGVWRRVDESVDGRQYVIDGEGQKVYDFWFIPPDEPTPTVNVNVQPRP